MKDRLPDPRFPVPIPPGKPQKSSSNREFYPEIDINSGSCVMKDGRPARFENWLDCDTQTFCRTVYYSTLDAEDWDERRHYDFLKESDLLNDKTRPDESVGLNRSDDEAGQSWWSVTVGVFDDEED